ncbi:MAG: PAS domain S-box protein [Anaerolineae bacterium]|nr:PAS domain S-box protein [Anaerolineae bacterium]
MTAPVTGFASSAQANQAKIASSSSTVSDLRGYIRRLTVASVIGMMLIAGLNLASVMVFSRLLEQNQVGITYVNMAEEQRILAQRIVLQSIELVTDVAPLSENQFSNGISARSATRASLVQVIVQMERLHRELSEISPLPPTLNALYNDPPTHLNDTLARYLEAARRLATASNQALTTANSDFVFILETSTQLSQWLGQVVQIYQQESLTQVDFYNQVNRFRAALVMIALLAIVLLIARPAVNRLREKAAQVEVEIAERMRTENALKESEQRFRVLVDSAPVGILQTDEHGNALFINKSWREMTGLSEEQTNGRGWTAALHPDDVPKLQAAVAKNEHLQSEFHFDTRYRRGEEVLYVHSISVPLRRADGTVSGYLTSASDLTLNHDIQTKLEERNRLIESILNSSLAGIAISDGNGRLRFVNARAEQLLESNQEQLMQGQWNTPDSSLYVVAGEQTVPEQLSPAQIMETGKPFYGLRYKHHGANGAEHYFSVNAAPLDDPSGKREVVYSFNEITEQVQAEQKLRLSERRFRALVDYLPIGVFQTDADGNCTFVNDRWIKITGLPLEEAKGAGWVKALHPDDLDTVFSQWRSMVSARRDMNLAFRFQRGGVPIYVHCTATPLHDEEGTISGYLGTVVDITLIRQTQLELEARNRLIEGVLNTSVAAITIADERGIKYANPRAQELLTLVKSADFTPYYDPPEWKTLHVDGSPLEQHEYTFGHVLRTGQPIMDVQRVLEWPNGTRKYVSVNAAPLISPEGIREVVNSVDDITARVQAEAALRENEIRFRTLVSAAPVGILETDANGNSVFYNDHWLEMFEYTPERAAGHGWTQVLPPEIKGRISALIELGDNPGIMATDHTYQRRSSVLYAHAVSVPLYQVDGTFKGYLTAVTDVSAARQAQLELESRNRLIEGVLNSSADAITIVTEDAYIRYANPRTEEIFQLSKDQIVGKLYTSLGFKVLRLDGKPVGQAEGIFAQVRLSGQPQYNVRYVFEWGDGRRKYVLINASPLDNPENDKREVVFSITDITDQMEAEQKLRESDEMFQLIAEHVNEIFYIIDPRTAKVLFISPALAKIHGIEQPRVSSGDLSDLAQYTQFVHPDDVELLLSRQIEMLQGGQGGQGDLEYRIVRPDGEIRYLWGRAFSVYDEQGELTRIVGFISDITERKKSEKQASELTNERQRVELLADFIRDTSHDLRTPITVITTSLYSVRQLEDPVRRNAKIDAIEAQLKYLNNLIEQLQQMAVLDSIREIKTTPFNINRMVKDAINAVTTETSKRGQMLGYSFERDLPLVELDVEKFYRALRNVLDNAIYFTPDGGSIQLTTRLNEQEHTVVIEIADSGNGIPADQLPRVFERFYKVDRSRGLGSGGSGLGLAMVKRILELHGGRVEMQSEVGVGTKVQLILPLLTEPVAAS